MKILGATVVAVLSDLLMDIDMITLDSIGRIHILVLRRHY